MGGIGCDDNRFETFLVGTGKGVAFHVRSRLQKVIEGGHAFGGRQVQLNRNNNKKCIS